MRVVCAYRLAIWLRIDGGTIDYSRSIPSARIVFILSMSCSLITVHGLPNVIRILLASLLRLSACDLVEIWVGQVVIVGGTMPM